MWLHARLVWMSWIEGRHCGTCSRRDQWSCVSGNVSCIHQYSPLSSGFVWQCKCERSWLCVMMQVRSCFQTRTPPTKQRGRSSHSTHLGRQVGSQHVFITGLVILPKVQTNGLCQLSLEWVSHLKWGRSARMTVHRYYRNLSIDSLH